MTTPDEMFAACDAHRRQRRAGPDLHVLTLDGGVAAAWIDEFIALMARCGFSVKQHTSMEAFSPPPEATPSVILMNPGAAVPESALRTCMARYVETTPHILSVGAEPADVREGDRLVPYFVHPHDDARWAWLAAFILRALGVLHPSSRP